MSDLIGKIIAAHRKKNHMSQLELAEKLSVELKHEISNKSVSKWENGTTEPEIAVFFNICKLLGITDPYTEYFGKNPADPFSSLNESGTARVLEYISLLSKDERFRRPVMPQSSETEIIPFRMIPMQLYPVSAGPGTFLDEENYENVPVGSEIPSTADFAVRVSGDSMEPLLHKNQVIYIHKQNTLESGEIGIFFLDGEAYVKKFRRDSSGTFLISLNENYAPMEITSESNFKIFGKLVSS